MNPVDEQSQFARNNKKIIIVVLIVLAALAAFGIVFIAVSVPAWKSTVKSGNETIAVRSLEAIRTVQAQYASKHQGIFAPDFDELIKAGLLDEKFAGQNPIVDGYIFSMKVEPFTPSKPGFYSVNADPQVAEATGTRHFYLNSTLATTKVTEENRPAKADDPSL